MLASSIPTKVSVIWGASAGGSYIRTVPIPSQIGITAGAASFTDGFPPLNFLAVESGGIPPAGQDLNGALNAITAWTQWQSAGGLTVYDGTFSTAVGGYPKGALLAKAAGGGVWLSQVDNNTANPDTGGANWTGIGSGPSTTVLTSGSGIFTSPSGTSWLEIIMVGGGSGGGGSGTGSPGVGTAGTATTFGTSFLIANGGPATPTNTSATPATPAAATGGDVNIVGGLGGPASALAVGTSVASAAAGASTPLGNGGTPGAVIVGNTPIASGNASGYGAAGGGGGYGAGSSGSYNTGWGGNAGAYSRKIITSPATSYAYVVGAAGSGGAAGTGGAVGGAGTPGLIIVIAH